ncbi:hypothetical protein RIF29_20405 [Crotalaria pallida]|uniref:Uncharacterized protein n=1 Tax=Crotalaria pallida TaxID=3830 RepID=A0AAN9I6A8_CROPI
MREVMVGRLVHRLGAAFWTVRPDVLVRLVVWEQMRVVQRRLVRQVLLLAWVLMRVCSKLRLLRKPLSKLNREAFAHIDKQEVQLKG